MDKYIINRKTLAIFPCENDKSLVYEGTEMFVVNSTPNNIIKRNCLRYGSTYAGRLKSAEEVTGSRYKTPIILSGSNRLIFFPTSSPRLKSVAWISMRNVDKVYYNALKHVTTITFCNDIIIEVNASLNIINNQLFKSMQLEAFLKKKRGFKV